MARNVLIWGMGYEYNRRVNLLKYYEIIGQIKVIAITSNDNMEIKEIDGHIVCPKKDINSLNIDFIVVMNGTSFSEIVNEIMDLGIKRNKIIHYRVLDIPQFDFEDYILLKESNISILSNNCWGGLIYHTLDLECLSPFKNLSVGCEAYIEIIKNLKEYMACELQFKRYALEPHSHIRYPVMELGGQEIHCNHDTNPEDAKKKWDRRVRKINYDNLFYEMYTDSRENAQKFCELKNCDRKVCFVPFDTDRTGQMKLLKWRNQTEFYETVNANAGVVTGSYKFNPINLLLGKEAERCR